jgi:prolipoprotein diacylglyceryltransferase
MLIGVGSTRFITEFFINNEKIVLGCSAAALHAAAMLVVGTIALAYLQKTSGSNSAKKSFFGGVSCANQR